MARDYDPSVGQAFSTWYYRRARRRVIDRITLTHGDKRRGQALKKLEFTYPSMSLNQIADASPDARWLVVDDPEPDSLVDAIIELGRDLSADARWALVNVAGRMAEGANEWTALQESKNGISYAEAKRRLELLREELRP